MPLSTLESRRTTVAETSKAFFPEGTPEYIINRHAQTNDPEDKTALVEKWTAIMNAVSDFPTGVLPAEPGSRYSAIGTYVRLPEDLKEDFVRMYSYIRNHSTILGHPSEEDVKEFSDITDDEKEYYLKHFVTIKVERARISNTLSVGKLISSQKTQISNAVDELEISLECDLENEVTDRLKSILAGLRLRIRVSATRRTTRSDSERMANSGSHLALSEES